MTKEPHLKLTPTNSALSIIIVQQEQTIQLDALVEPPLPKREQAHQLNA